MQTVEEVDRFEERGDLLAIYLRLNYWDSGRARFAAQRWWDGTQWAAHVA